MADSTVTRQRGEGQALWMLGGLYEVKVGSDESDGAMTVMEMTIPPGMGPPPHTHPGTESVYVLDGTLRYHIGGKVYDGAAGSVFHIPAGVVENFEPTGDKPLRVLVIYTPGGKERFFLEYGEVAKSRDLPPPDESPPDLERLTAIASRYGMEVRLPS
ncbi:MAG TPA: cupin domain-containing protein [Acidimicrobiales bacterium]|nr:cupin domain-containing protein [Acidimicrobiales bacterium]